MHDDSDEYLLKNKKNLDNKARNGNNDNLAAKPKQVQQEPAMAHIFKSAELKPRVEYPVEDVKSAVGKFRFYALILALSFFCIGFHCLHASNWALGPSYATDLQLNPDKVNAMHSLQSFAQLPSSLFGAFLVAKYVGAAESLCSGILVAFLGAITLALGITFNIYPIILLGRFLIGILYEVMNVAQFVITSNMYGDYYLNTIFTLQFGFLKIGGGIAFLVVGSIYNWVFMTFKIAGPKQLGITIFLILIPILVCDLPSACVICMTYKRFKKKVKNPPNEHTRPSIKTACLENIVNLEVAQVLIMLTAIIVKPVSEIFIFHSVQEFISKNEITWIKSLSVVSIFDFMQGFLGPLVGLILDYKSNNYEMVILSTVCVIAAISIQNFTNMYILPIIILSVGYTIFISSYWLIISKSKTSDKSFNLGIGLMLLGLSRTILYYEAGVLLETYGYFVLNTILINLVIGAFTISCTAQRFALKNQ